ncbi:hypothetical protein ACP70R_031516 [Stipagrostis hirtigluma subsp. patula]
MASPARHLLQTIQSHSHWLHLCRHRLSTSTPSVPLRFQRQRRRRAPSDDAAAGLAKTGNALLQDELRNVLS